MPLKLSPPRPGKTPNYSIRGTHFGIVVDRTAGTPDRKTAQKVLNRIKDDIERGAYARKGEVTFADGALSYVRNGGETTFLAPLVEHFKTTPLKEIEQADIDEAAVLLYPTGSAATRNRQVYTPISAILKHNKINVALKRPKGAQGEVKVDWLWPEQAAVFLEAAGEIDLEFQIFLTLLLYSGPRLTEALNIEIDDVRLSESFAFCGKTKNGAPRPMHLPPVVVAALANHPRGLDRPNERLFRFKKNGHLYNLLKDVKTRARLPQAGFHMLRHTWATWMRRYGGLDTKGLVGTGAWKDEKSASRYQHVVVSEESQRADRLPVPKRRGRTG